MVSAPSVNQVQTLSKTVVLAGPTAAGKTALALELVRMARQQGIEIEIVNSDSMQVYRGMDIGTAKPTCEELAQVPHHLIDIRDPSEPYTAGEFVREVKEAIAEIESRGRRALLVGGTGFYLRALFWGIWDGPPADAQIRARLDTMPPDALHSTLMSRDPKSAIRIGPADRYRLTRALELIELQGKSPTELEAEMNGTPDPRFELWVVDREANELEARMKVRSRQMLDEGLIEEVHRIRLAHPSARALGAVGYKEVCAYLDGLLPEGRKIAPGLQGLQSEIELATRQLIKKQRTWFKSLSARLGPKAARRFVLPGDEGWRAEFARVYGAGPG